MKDTFYIYKKKNRFRQIIYVQNGISDNGEIGRNVIIRRVQKFVTNYTLVINGNSNLDI